MKRLIGPILLLAALLASPNAAMAYKGCYAAGLGGAAVSSTESSIAALNDGGAVTSAVIAAVLGCDARFGKQAFAGLWVEGDLYRNHDGTAVLVGTSGATLDKSFAAGARLGWMLTPYTGAYAKLGWGWTWTKDISAGALSFNVPMREGPVAGIGIETKLTKFINLDVSYLGWFNHDETVATPGGPLNLKDRTDTVRIGFVVRLNEITDDKGKRIAP